MPRPIQAFIHRDALAHNFHRIRDCTQDAKIFAVVKANAYGHGIEHVYESFRAADGFALLELTEAARLRGLGYRGPILLLEGVFEARDLETCSRLQLWHVVHNEAQINWLAAHKTEIGHRVFLKLNSGMNRLGFTPSAYRSAYYRLASLQQVDEISHMTHFANADQFEIGVQRRDQTLFFDVTQGLGGDLTLANSAALLRGQREQALQADWVRAGIALYGSSPDYPSHSIGDWDLQATMSLRSQIISVQDVDAGESIGYGATFTASHRMRVGVVACGYADGYPRHAPTGTPVLVQGQVSRTLGRVSMDMLVVDLTHLPRATFGSEVTLWGRSALGAQLDIDEVAASAGTIGYELMCALTQRVRIEAV